MDMETELKTGLLTFALLAFIAVTIVLSFGVLTGKVSIKIVDENNTRVERFEDTESLVKLVISPKTKEWVSRQFSKECGKLFYEYYSGGGFEDYKCITSKEWVMLYREGEMIDGVRVLRTVENAD